MSSSASAEEWRDLAGWDGVYQVSSLGRVRSVRILKPVLKEGYENVSLCRNNVARSAAIHTLVLEAFVGPRPKGHVCAHGNGNKRDNRPENLRWATYAENYEDSRRHGTNAQGARHGRSRLRATG